MGFYRVSFVAGLAVGFVAGTRAGRERYDQMVKVARNAAENPAVQQAAGAIQAQAAELFSSAAKKVGDNAPHLAQSAAHTIGDRIPGMKHRNGHGNGSGQSRPFEATSNSHLGGQSS